MRARLLTGDCRDLLATLPDASVNCCVTSPPYFGLRDYGVKHGGDWFAEARAGGAGGTMASEGSKSPARKAASAMIAKIPEPLSRHIGLVYWPTDAERPAQRQDAA